MKTKEKNAESGKYTDKDMFTVLFDNKAQAEEAYNDLTEKGYAQEEIHIAMSERTRKRHFEDNLEVRDSVSVVAEDSAKGGAIGALAGATLAVLAVSSSLVIPGIGLIIAGPAAAALAGAGAGAVSGGIIGALVGAGVPETHAEIMESGVKKGKIVIGFRPHSVEDIVFFERRWRHHLSADK